MWTRSLLWLAVAVAGASASARGAPAPHWRRPVLVELYTSQGCSSCPPANAFVRQLASLGLGRDKDGAAGLDGLYTPQMVVDGAVQFSGQRRQTALHEMEAAAARPPAFDLTVRALTRGSVVDLTVQSAPPRQPGRDRDWRLVAALAAKTTRTVVARGENAGDALDEAAVVRALSDRIAMPAEGGATRFQLAKPADLSWADVEVVVFAQSETTREIGAVRALDAGQLGHTDLPRPAASRPTSDRAPLWSPGR